MQTCGDVNALNMFYRWRNAVVSWNDTDPILWYWDFKKRFFFVRPVWPWYDFIWCKFSL